jgi:hypothetical protein
MLADKARDYLSEASFKVHHSKVDLFLRLSDLLGISVAKEAGAYQSGAPGRLSTLSVSSWLYPQVLDKHLKYCQGITL